MSQIRIFIETKTLQGKQTNEERFIWHIVELLNGDLEKIKVSGTNGYTNLEQYQNQMQRNTALGGKNLVIFDADFPTTGGGFATRKEELLKEKQKLNVDFELFLFPNNNEDGTFEHLLEQLTVEEHKGLLECFEGYEMCINGHNKTEYETPDQKAKMYTYVSTFKKTQSQTTAFKSGDWFFNRTDLWNFDAEYLNTLKEFLTAHLPLNP